MRRGYPYIRFSSPEQRQGDSLRRQLRECQQWCDRNGVVYDDSLDYLQELGRSAFRGSNLEEGGGLGLFLAAVNAGHVQAGSCLLVEKLDRFSRTDVDIAVHFFGKVLRAGITIVSIRSGQEYTLEMLRRQPTAILPAVLELILANEESVKKSDRGLSVWLNKREEARASRAVITKKGPLWLRLSADRQSWEVIEERKAVVVRIFEGSANGVGGHRLAAMLNKECVPTFEGRPFWTPRMIQRIQTNRAVLGEFQPQKRVAGKLVNEGDVVPSYFPAVVDDGLFYRALAQATVARKGGRKSGGRAGNLFLFQKLAFDGDTGSSLVIRATKSMDRYIRYLIPSAGLRGGRRATVPVDVFEETMLKVLSEIRPDDLVPSVTTSEIEKQIKDMDDGIAELSVRIAAATAAMASQPAHLMGSVVAQIAAWEQQKREMALEQGGLKTQAVSTASQVVREFHDVLDVLRTCEPSEVEMVRHKLRAVIRSLVKKVTVLIRPVNHLVKRVGVAIEFNHSEETRIVFFRSPFTTLLVLKGFTAEDLTQVIDSQE